MCLSIGLAGAAIAFAQSPVSKDAEYRQIVQSMQALDASITLDRQEYLQGEQIEATAVVFNPTSGPIHAFAPFRSPYTRISVATLNKQGEWQSIGSGDMGIAGAVADMMDNRKVITINPGERLIQKVSLMDAADNSDDAIPHDPLPVLPPATYRMRFGYERPAQVSFRILPVEGRITTASKAIPAAESVRKKKSPVAKGCGGMWAAALQSAGKTILVVSVSGMVDVCRPRDLEQDALLPLLSPFTRVAEGNDVRAVALDLMADGAVNLTWADGRGAQQQRSLPPRLLRDPKRSR